MVFFLFSYSADKEIGIQPITEVLVLNVTDSKQNLLPNQVLSIVVEPVDNQPPSVVVGEDIKVCFLHLHQISPELLVMQS